MDTSSEYIDMCSKAEELQQLAKQEILSKNMKLTLDSIFIRKNNLGIYQFFNRSGMSGYYMDAEKHCEENSWLPRQDQLQEILLKETKDDYIFAQFAPDIISADKLNSSITGRFKSQEQKWLAFLMSLAFNKIWNNETKEWCKNEI